MSSNYNFIYKKLVEAPNDVVGALAYALYKQEKIEFIEKFQKTHNRAPTDTDLKSFYHSSTTPSRLLSYEQSAESLLNNFLGQVLTETLQQQHKELQQDSYTQNLKNVEKNISGKIDAKHSFWRGVGQNIVAGIFATILTFGFILAAWMWSEGPDNIVAGAWQKYHKGANESPSSKSGALAIPEKQSTAN